MQKNRFFEDLNHFFKFLELFFEYQLFLLGNQKMNGIWWFLILNLIEVFLYSLKIWLIKVLENADVSMNFGGKIMCCNDDLLIEIVNFLQLY